MKTDGLDKAIQHVYNEGVRAGRRAGMAEALRWVKEWPTNPCSPSKCMRFDLDSAITAKLAEIEGEP